MLTEALRISGIPLVIAISFPSLSAAVTCLMMPMKKPVTVVVCVTFPAIGILNLILVIALI